MDTWLERGSKMKATLILKATDGSMYIERLIDSGGYVQTDKGGYITYDEFVEDVAQEARIAARQLQRITAGE